LNLLDRYIFKSVLLTCAAAIGLFAFIVIVPNVARDLLPYILAGQLPWDTFTKLVLLLLPFAITYALPMGILTGVLLTLGRLSADSEITAMRAAGISVRRLARPVLILASACAAIALYFNFDSMPRARVEYHEEFAAAVRANPLSFIVPKTFIRNFTGCIIYVNEKHGNELRDLWVWELDSERRVKRLDHAESGKFEYDENENILTLTLARTQVETLNEKNPENLSESPLLVAAEKSDPIRISLDQFFQRSGAVHIKQEWLTYDKLQAERARLAALPVPADRAEAKAAARDRMRLELIYQDKFNTALAVLSLSLVGIPLGIRVSRRETSANFAVAVGITLTYYLLTVAVKVLDRHPEYRPDLLLWVPNLLLIGIGIWLFRRVEKR
jgi:lipopolysaccharide export system permease protein